MAPAKGRIYGGIRITGLRFARPSSPEPVAPRSPVCLARPFGPRRPARPNTGPRRRLCYKVRTTFGRMGGTGESRPCRRRFEAFFWAFRYYNDLSARGVWLAAVAFSGAVLRVDYVGRGWGGV